MEETAPQRRTALPTYLDVSQNLLVSPVEVYEGVLEKSLAENMTLEEALGNTDPSLSGLLPDDAFPASVASQIGSGIFPPATLAEIEYLRVENKNASRGEVLRRMLLSGSLTLSDTKGYRTRTAYRLVRQMARVRGLLDGFGLLYVSMGLSPDASGIPLWHMPVPLADTRFLTGNRGIRAVLSEIDASGARYTFNTSQGFVALGGSTTLPPPVPDSFYPSNPAANWRMRVNRKVPPSYDPRNDLALVLWCEAMAMLSEQLDIPRGSPEEPWAGEYGLAGLLNPYTARNCWPTRDELVMYEEELVLKVFDKASCTSTRGTELWLQRFFGLSRLEALDLVKTAVAVGSALYSEGSEEMRALELKRLDSLEDKCDNANDPRALIAAKRLKFQAMGLTRQEDAEGMAALRDAAIQGLREADTEEDDYKED